MFFTVWFFETIIGIGWGGIAGMSKERARSLSRMLIFRSSATVATSVCVNGHDRPGTFSQALVSIASGARSADRRQMLRVIVDHMCSANLSGPVFEEFPASREKTEHCVRSL